ncbi:MAG: type I-B CRISPR-associated protein Cas5b [Candidatus Omnitrophica bacterium]|nr:type I-B CRISPR-associated protein Cas5b [Candidatus Omnitrophota bacterium]
MSKVLKIKIYQPTANYRVPFSYSRRLTYPIPPFSTLKGFLCNVLGIKNDNNETFGKIKEISVAIFGRYESLVKEYIWFRNLKKESHIERFGHVTNRIKYYTPQHPGGQIPVIVDTLENVELVIYIHHRDQDFLAYLKNALTSPVGRNTVLHLGRSEDWLVINCVGLIDVSEKQKNFFTVDYFTWIPNKDFIDREFIRADDEEYGEFFNNTRGNFVRIPTFYEIIEGQRIFTKFVFAKLFEKGFIENFSFYYDEEEKLPFIFTKLNGNEQ